MIKYFSLLIGLLFFVSCDNPSEKKMSDSQEFTTPNNLNPKKDKVAEISMKSEITCPKCGYKKTENLPTDVCLIKYTCKKCKLEMNPKKGDCCVFCTYGTHKCPSMQ